MRGAGWSIVKRLCNVPAMWRHVSAAQRARVDGSVDLELDLYARMFQNDFLHAGYFAQIPDDPEKISLHELKQAMRAYAQLLVDRVAPGEKVLDVGCGIGGLLVMLRDARAQVTALTPNPGHAEHIRAHHPGVGVIARGFESLDLEHYRQAFDVVVCSESFHNVPLEAGVRIVKTVLKPGGRWLVIDYYRLHERAYNRSGHLLEAFRETVARNGFRLIEEVDVTANTTPTLGFFHTLVQRIGLPLVDFGAERLFLKHPVIGYLFGRLYAEKRRRVRLDALDPKVFTRDKRYLLQQFTL